MVDAVSVALLKAAATGQHFNTVTIDAFAVGSDTPFATYTFESVVVTSDVIGSSPNALAETAMFQFGGLRSHIVLGGSQFDSCWDVVSNTNC
jgi:type VI protein secretion system component Hcp